MFNFSNGSLVLDPDIIVVNEFATIYDRDKSPNKEQAYKEFQYIYFTTDFKSPYADYKEDEKIKTIIANIFNSNWKPDKAIEDAIIKYKELRRTPTMYLMECAREAIYHLGDVLKHPDSSTKDILAVLKQVKETVANYDGLKDAVEKEISKKGIKRGSTKVGSREIPKTKN